jgi:hypothetical protein
MNSRLPTQDPPTLRDIVADVDPVIGTVFVAGPPVIPAVTASVLFGLLLAGPFALLVVIVIAIVAAWALVALVGAILVSPFLLARHLRAHRQAHAESEPAAQPVAQPVARPVAQPVARPVAQPAAQFAAIRSQQVAA